MAISMKDQRGDTIVEVLVALSIIAAVIATVFTAANNSRIINQQSQERSAAVRVAESQMELIKALANLPGEQANEDMFTVNLAGEGFCLRGGSDIEIYVYNTITNLDDDPLTVNPAGPYISDCVFGDRYYVYNERFEEIGGTRQRFRTTVQWERLGGGRDRVEMVYGIEKSEISLGVTLLARIKESINSRVSFVTDQKIAYRAVRLLVVKNVDSDLSAPSHDLLKFGQSIVTESYRKART